MCHSDQSEERCLSARACHTCVLLPAHQGTSHSCPQSPPHVGTGNLAASLKGHVACAEPLHPALSQAAEPHWRRPSSPQRRAARSTHACSVSGHPAWYLRPSPPRMSPWFKARPAPSGPSWHLSSPSLPLLFPQEGQRGSPNLSCSPGGSQDPQHEPVCLSWEPNGTVHLRGTKGSWTGRGQCHDSLGLEDLSTYRSRVGPLRRRRGSQGSVACSLGPQEGRSILGWQWGTATEEATCQSHTLQDCHPGECPERQVRRDRKKVAAPRG